MKLDVYNQIEEKSLPFFQGKVAPIPEKELESEGFPERNWIRKGPEKELDPEGFPKRNWSRKGEILRNQDF
ncbi:hypothetical protein A9996_09560 [Gelidibacter algens]|nr:hypothetical protein A9996_09560 [Gelidibacter algens]